MKKFTTFTVLGLALILVLGIGAVQAENRAGTFNLSPFVGYHKFDGGQELDNHVTYGLGLGYNLTKHWGLEAVYSYTPTESDLGLGDAKSHFYHLDGLYHFMPDNKLVPYVAFGLGGATYDYDWKGNSTTLAANYGVGIKYFFNETVAFRADLRHHLLAEDSHSDFTGTVGLTFQFGKPAPAPEPAPMQETKSYKMVVLFDFDKTIIKPEFHTDLQKMADFMKEHPETSGEIQGHTDSIGSEQYNMGLSIRRANAVKDYLVNKLGISADRLSVKGFGETKPAASNATKEGRKLNRRAEAVSAIEVTVK